MEIKTWRDLRDVLNTLNDEQLDQRAHVNGEETYTEIGEAYVSNTTFFYNEDSEGLIPVEDYDPEYYEGKLLEDEFNTIVPPGRFFVDERMYMNAKPEKLMPAQISSIERLTSLQWMLGYKEGELSTVAMLGLVGEAGEVLAETYFSENNAKEIEAAIVQCKIIESLKKRVRSGANHTFIYVQEEKLPAFKSELADTAYYLNILATNIGSTLGELCEIAHDKVVAKQAAGGSSEDRRDK